MDSTVTMGAHEDVPVYPQRHAYLTNKLAGFFSRLQTASQDVDISSAEDVIPILGDHAYDLIAVVIPTYAKRCPKYEFCGYGSKEAYDAREYDETQDTSPSFPEILNAFEVATAANRFDVLKIIGKVVDPKMLKQWVNTQLAIAISGDSLSSAAPLDGFETSTVSGVTMPTYAENAE